MAKRVVVERKAQALAAAETASVTRATSTSSDKGIGEVLPSRTAVTNASTQAVCPLSCLHNFMRSEEHTSELQSQSNLVCRPLLDKQYGIAHHEIWGHQQFSAVLQRANRRGCQPSHHPGRTGHIGRTRDHQSTRLKSSHLLISYDV